MKKIGIQKWLLVGAVVFVLVMMVFGVVELGRIAKALSNVERVEGGGLERYRQFLPK